MKKLDMTDNWTDVLNPDTPNPGYSGRKLDEYVWIPKPKTALREYRLNLKLCKDVQEERGYFNDELVGEYAVEEGNIYDGKLEPEGYLEKYEEKDVSMKTYVSNIRMFIRIARFLGWITVVPESDSKYLLTDRGEVLTQFRGEFPDTSGGLEEEKIVRRSFANLCFYSVNDDPDYWNLKFKTRIFLNMLSFIRDYNFAHHLELAVTAFTLKDERDPRELEEKRNILDGLRSGELTLVDAFEMNDFPLDESTKNGVYDGPKVLLSFARQLGLADSTYISKMENSDEVYSIYEQEYETHPHAGTPRVVYQITAEGEQFLDKYMSRKKIWFDEL
jgi:hypothetical protein